MGYRGLDRHWESNLGLRHGRNKFQRGEPLHGEDKCKIKLAVTSACETISNSLVGCDIRLLAAGKKEEFGSLLVERERRHNTKSERTSRREERQTMDLDRNNHGLA
ncbi:uncharacterized protein LOC143661019 isoform X2 [Tamandua tetradactyla]|uniref:uncharacterized protein LOC143661019 isoform X2 n=1 Tax=Tamandua tetradactyla TaxID=48850 RepID=UPI0040542052